MSRRAGDVRSACLGACVVALLAAPRVHAQSGASPSPVAAAPAAAAPVLAESDAYAVDYLVPPDGAVLEVGGLDFLSDGRLVLSTRRGQVWLVDQPLAADPRDAHFTLFAEGLDEGLGLAVTRAPGPDGTPHDAVCVMQRGELTRLTDTDGDDRADRRETICADWGLSGNYHEFGYGLPVDAAGNFYASLNVSFFSPKWWHGKSPVPYRGWVLQISPDGTMTPYAFGFRSPCGLGFNAAGDLFATDNQGDWEPAGPIHHVVPGRFYGHPASLDWTEENRAHAVLASDTLPVTRARAPAAVWLPYKWSRSAGNLVNDGTAGRFGPFADQFVVAELTNGLLLRAQMEKVRGEYQGTAFLLRQRIGSICRVAFAPDGTLFCGLTNRGWGGVPPNDGLARVRWTGRLPLEMHSVHLLQDGFQVRFTRPLRADVVLAPADISASQYDYDYWWEYGSPERHTRTAEVLATEISADRRTLTLRLADLRPAMMARVAVHGAFADDGSPLLHEEFAYTLNQLPEGPATTELIAKLVPPPPPRESGDDGWLRLTFGDAKDAWQSTGWSLVDAELDAAEPTRFRITPGNNSLVNLPAPAAATPAAVPSAPLSPYVGKYALGDGKYHIEFMLPEGGGATVYVMGRYGLRLDPGPANGALCASGGAPERAPALPSFQGPGIWHELDLLFEAPRFDESGRKVVSARMQRVTIDDVLLHESVELPGPSPGAPLGPTPAVALGADGVGGIEIVASAAELPLAPLVIVGDRGPLALRTLQVKPPDPLADRAGWVPLFNGEDLRGWKVSPDAQPAPAAADAGAENVAGNAAGAATTTPASDAGVATTTPAADAGVATDADSMAQAPTALAGFLVEDGILTGTGPACHIFSPRGDYTNVALRAQVRINDGGNSGMYVRAGFGPGWPAGYEAQVNSSHADPVRTGSLYGLAPVAVSLIPPDTWFTQEVTCREAGGGTHITIAVNGVVVTDFLDTQRLHGAGHIALQQHHDGSVVEYRSVEVRELPPEAR